MPYWRMLGDALLPKGVSAKSATSPPSPETVRAS
jgi:hypothetical protein